jgi:hypothetical protein
MARELRFDFEGDQDACLPLGSPDVAGLMQFYLAPSVLLWRCILQLASLASRKSPMRRMYWCFRNRTPTAAGISTSIRREVPQNYSSKLSTIRRPSDWARVENSSG